MIYLTKWGLAALIALAPLPLGANRPWSWSLLALGVGVCLLLWTAAAMGNRGVIRMPSRRYGGFTILYGLLLLWFLIQAATFTPQAWHHPLWEQVRTAFSSGDSIAIRSSISLDREATLTGVMRLLAYGCIFWLALQFGRSRNGANRMLWAVAAAAFVYGVYGLVIRFADLQMLLWYDKWAYQDSVTGPFVNRNNFATYVGIGLLVSLVLLWREFGRATASGPAGAVAIRAVFAQIRPRAFILIGMAATLATALLLTGSRGGMAATCVGGVVLILALIVVHRHWLAVATTAAIVAGGTLILGAVGLDRLEGRFAAMPIEVQHRAALHAQSITAIGDRPIFGTGLGTYRDTYNLYKDYRLPFWSLPTDKAHNSYLELAVEGGLPALAILVMVFALIVRRCLIGLFRRRQELALPALGLAVTALVGAHAMVDFSMQIPAIAATYAYVMGAACAQSWPTQAERAAAALGSTDRMP